MSDRVALISTLPRLAPRTADSHKGDYGRVLVVAGRRGMTGAAVLCASAALRAGAGLVTVACPDDVLPIIAAANPCYMTHGLPHHPKGGLSLAALPELVELCQAVDVLALGPGLGRSPELTDLVSRLLKAHPELPTIVDADGLNALASLKPGTFKNRQHALLFTPHFAEFARLIDSTSQAVQGNRESLAIDFARQHEVSLLLKGHRSLITDGSRLAVNETGNPGMATGGTGDVLTGLIAGLAAQGLQVFEAAMLGAWVHGRAGDLAAAAESPVSLIASDLLAYLPAVFQELAAGSA